MRRSRLGDVYATKVPNGYKLYQRAYDIPKQGRFIRVFDGLYDSVPGNIEAIVSTPHSYIINFFSSRAYRIGLAEFVGNYPVPEKYPFPEYMVDFHQNTVGEIFRITVLRTDITGLKSFHVGSMKELPEEFQNLKLLRASVTPNWLLYLFDINWNLDDLARFYPGRPGEDFASILQPYSEMVNRALESDKVRRGR